MESSISNQILMIPIVVLLLFVIFLSLNTPYIWAQPNQYIKERSAQNTSILIKKLNDREIDLIYNQGNYTGAIKYFDKILAINPNNVGAIFFKGAALSSPGKSSEAIPFINKALMLSLKIPTLLT